MSRDGNVEDGHQCPECGRYWIPDMCRAFGCDNSPLECFICSPEESGGGKRTGVFKDDFTEWVIETYKAAQKGVV